MIFKNYKQTWAVPAGLLGMIVVGVGLTVARYSYVFLADRPNAFSILEGLFPEARLSDYYAAIMAIEGGVLGSLFGFGVGFFLGYDHPRSPSAPR